MERARAGPGAELEGETWPAKGVMVLARVCGLAWSPWMVDKRGVRCTFGSAVVALGVIACLSSVAAASAAHDTGRDGRWKGDLTLVAGLGAAMSLSPTQGFSSLDLRARYLQTAGVVVAYDESALWRPRRQPGAWQRMISAGVELRPLFPGLFLKNMETGNDWVNLTLTSLGLELGVVWTERWEVPSTGPGLYAGAAFEVPLSSSATGLWLRFAGQGRWTEAALTGEQQPMQRAVLLGMGIAWHQVLDAHLATGRDRRLE